MPFCQICEINSEGHVELLLLCYAKWKHNLWRKVLQNKRKYISY